jgi:hypothetical protein
MPSAASATSVELPNFDRELIRIRQIPLDPLPEGGLQRGGEAARRS